MKMPAGKRSLWILALVAASALALVLTVWLMKGNPPPGPAEKIRIAGLSLPGAGLFFVAKEQGLFRAEGLEVDLQLHPTGKLALDALGRGAADFAIAGDTPLVFSILAGRKLDILATVYRPNGGISIIARKERVATPGDLKGKRLGVTLVSSGQFVADTFLLVHSIAPGAVKLVNLPQDEMAAALLAGTIDAACLWQPALAQMQASLGEQGITFPNDGLYTFRLSLVAPPGAAAAQPERSRKLLAALKQAQGFIGAQPEQALDIMSRSTGIPVALFQRFFSPAEYDLGLEQGLLLALDDQSRWAIKNGFIKTDKQADKLPNYLDYLWTDGLTAVSPASVKIIR
jgi:NitT/TauT family transport system substrate-binding protein